MSLEVLNTTGTLLTVLIVATAAIAALVQLRHLRAGNQITALLTIGDRFQDSGFRDALYAINHGLAQAMNDEVFRTYIESRLRGFAMPNVPPEYIALNQAATLVGNFYEQCGNLVKNGVVDETLFLDQYCNSAVGTWKRLEPYMAFMRAVTNDIGLWDNFEFLTVRAREFLRKYPTTYPKGVPRIEIENRWPIPARSD
ncbi:MAG: DUF4760 domain-containing protein [Candidatus Eremiobacteraeota bacterium]|nr:DUF4760 domain-containing protein [Candidatus Eremiobacteraeota bacterium]MBV8282509.1 DUF4760 domain-containing protein [Candidatus Eremiobacteraeota bacterium]